jgi:F-type H+-transporting ATPase subunit epsilon
MQLSILTPTGMAFQGTVEQLTAPGTTGSFGVLIDHSPLGTSLKAGELAFKSQGKWHRMNIQGGFVDVNSNVVTVLTAKAELVAEPE